MRVYHSSGKYVERVFLATDGKLKYCDNSGSVEDASDDFKKIAFGSHWAIASAGECNENLKRFYAGLRSSEKKGVCPSIVRAVETKYFTEFAELNRGIALKEGCEELPVFLLATSKPGKNPELYFVDIMGNVLTENPGQDFYDGNHLFLGPQAESLHNSLALDVDSTVGMGLLDAVKSFELLYDVLEKSTCPDSGGRIQIVSVTRRGVTNLSERLEELVKNAESEWVRETKKRLRN